MIRKAIPLTTLIAIAAGLVAGSGCTPQEPPKEDPKTAAPPTAQQTVPGASAGFNDKAKTSK